MGSYISDLSIGMPWSLQYLYLCKYMYLSLYTKVSHYEFDGMYLGGDEYINVDIMIITIIMVC